MRLSSIASLLVLGQIGCQDGPRSGKASVTAPATSNAEPALATASADTCEFDPPPFLVITSQQALLDGVVVDGRWPSGSGGLHSGVGIFQNGSGRGLGRRPWSILQALQYDGTPTRGQPDSPTAALGERSFIAPQGW